MKKYWLIALLIVIDVAAIATRNTPIVIVKDGSVSAVKEAQLKAVRILAARNQQMMDSIKSKVKASQPITPTLSTIHIRCSKSGYNRTIRDGTKLRYEWNENYLMIMNGDSITVYGRFLGDDCEVTRGNI